MSKIIVVTQSYDDLGNIDTEFYDLAQLTPDHPYRVAVEKALNNPHRVAVLDNYGQCFEPDTPLCEALMKATVELPATVVGQVHLQMRD